MPCFLYLMQFTTNGHQGLCSEAEHRKGNCDRLWRKNRRKVVRHACCPAAGKNTDALRAWKLHGPIYGLVVVQHAEILVDSIAQSFRSRCHGVDLNRNWPLDFSGNGKGLAGGAVCDETFHGEGFFSEPEVRADINGTLTSLLPVCDAPQHQPLNSGLLFADSGDLRVSRRGNWRAVAGDLQPDLPQSRIWERRRGDCCSNGLSFLCAPKAI